MQASGPRSGVRCIPEGDLRPVTRWSSPRPVHGSGSSHKPKRVRTLRRRGRIHLRLQCRARSRRVDRSGSARERVARGQLPGAPVRDQSGARRHQTPRGPALDRGRVSLGSGHGKGRVRLGADEAVHRRMSEAKPDRRAPSETLAEPGHPDFAGSFIPRRGPPRGAEARRILRPGRPWTAIPETFSASTPSPTCTACVSTTPRPART